VDNLTYYLEILKLEPENISALQGLTEIYKNNNQWNDLIELYEKLFNLSEDNDDRIAYILEIAAVHRYHLNNIDKAIEFYLDALELQFDEQSAIDALTEIFGSSDRLYELNILLEGKIYLTKDSEQATALTGTLIDNYISLENYDEALLKLSTMETPPPEIVKKVYDAINRNGLLSGIVEYRELFANVFKAPEELANFYSTLADIYERLLDNVYETAYNYEMVLALKPADHARILSKLNQIYSSIDEPILYLSVLLELKQTSGVQDTYDINKNIGICYIKLNESESAIQFLKAALSEKPDDKPLLYIMLEVYTQLGAAEELEDILKKLIEIESENDKKIPLYKKAIPVMIDKKDYDTAVRLIKTLIELTGDQSGYELLEKVYTENEDYSNLVTFYLERLNGKEEEKDSAPLWAALGNAYLKGFSHYDYAIDSYNRALTLDPSGIQYMRELVSLYSSAEKWRELEQIILKLIPLISDDDQKLSLNLMLGDLYLAQIRDYDKATVVYNEILTKRPNDITAILAMERIYRENSDYTGLEKILEKKLIITDKKYDTLIELGSILFNKGINLKQAQIYLWQALETDPSSGDAVDILKRLYETTGDYTGFDRLYSFLADKADNSPLEKVGLLLKLGHIRREKLALPDKAISTFEQAVAIEPDNHDANLTLARLYFNTGVWEKAEKHFNFSISHNIVSHEQLSEFLFEYARILDKLGRSSDALQYYRKAFELNGAEKKYAEAYGYSAYANKNHEAVISAFEALLKLSKPKDNISEIYKKLIYTYEATGDNRSASVYLMKLIEKEPANFKYLKWLEKLSTNSKDYSLLASTLKKEAELVETDEQKISITLSRAEILDEKLNKPQLSVKAIKELIKSGKRRLDIYIKLISFYKKLNNAADLILTIQETLKFPISGEQKTSLLFELASLYKNDAKKAIGIYKDILVLQPDNEPAFSSLCNIYISSEDYRTLSSLYEDRLPRIKSTDEAIQLQKKLAAVKVEKLNDLDGGISIYQNILKLKPSDPKVYPYAESLLIKKGNLQSLSRFYNSAASNIESPKLKFEYHIKSAELLLNQLKDTDGAIQSYESAFNLDKTDSDVIIRLARLTASQKMNEKAINYYKKAVGLKVIPEDTRAALNFEYGNLLKNDNISEAYQAYKEAYNLIPSNTDYRLSYGESAYAVGDYKETSDILKNVVYAHEQELSEEQLFPLYKILADCSRKLGSVQQAVEYLLRAVDINNKDIESLITLDGLTATLGNFELEVEVLRKLSKALSKPLDRVQALIKIAKLMHDKLYDLNGAIPLLRESMAITPQDIQIYKELIQIYREQSDIDNEIEILEKLLKIDKSIEGFVETSMRLGDIYIEFKNDLNSAKKYYLAALKKEPSSIPTLEALGKIFELQGNFSGMAELYQKFIKVLLPKDPRNVLPLLKELGKLYSTRLNNDELAIQQYQTIINIEPSDADAHFSLAELLAKDKNRLTEAVKEYNVVLRYRPEDITAIRFVARFYERKKDYDRMFLCYVILKLLGQEKDLERIFVDANKNKQSQRPKMPVTNDLFHAYLLHIKTRGPLKDIINVFSDYGKSIFKPDIKSYGIGKQERITAKSASWQEYGYLLQLLGIKDIDIYHAAKGNFKIAIENTDPPSLIVNTSSLSGLSPGEKTFIIIEYLTYIKSGFALPMKLGRQKFSLFINAMVKIFNPSMNISDDQNPDFAAALSSVSNALSKKQRTALVEPVKKYLKVHNHYIDDWFDGIEMTGVRTATFMIGDIEPVFSSLIKWHIGNISLLSNKEKRKDIFLSSELMRDMLQFYLSDGHFLLRNKLGMSILSV